jgi:hypothetical protein
MSPKQNITQKEIQDTKLTQIFHFTGHELRLQRSDL